MDKNIMHIDDYDDDDGDNDDIIITLNPPQQQQLIPTLNSTNEIINSSIDYNLNNTTDTNTTNDFVAAHEETQLNKLINNNALHSVNDDIAIQNELHNLVTDSILLPTSKCITVKYNNQIILIPATTKISDRLASLFWSYPKTYQKHDLPFIEQFNQSLLMNRNHTVDFQNLHEDIITSTTITHNDTDTKYDPINPNIIDDKYFATETYNNDLVNIVHDDTYDGLAFNGDTSSLDSTTTTTTTATTAAATSTSPTISTTDADNVITNSHNVNKCAIFAVKYKKNVICMNPNVMTNNTSTSGISTTANNSNYYNQDDNTFKRSNTGIYQYCDFAAVILQDGQVVDYAIHGYASNIADMINIHKPKYVYYNARPNDALDVFMNYPYQPFYSACYGKLFPVRINRTNQFFNPMAFCQRNDVFCALCNCLRDVRGLLIKLPTQITTVLNYNYHQQQQQYIQYQQQQQQPPQPLQQTQYYQPYTYQYHLQQYQPIQSSSSSQQYDPQQLHYTQYKYHYPHQQYIEPQKYYKKPMNLKRKFQHPFKQPHQLGKNHLMQPNYNTQRKRLQRALKKPGSFNGFHNERRILNDKFKY